MIRAILLSPAGELLAKATLLLALSWLANAFLLTRHARWRVMLWRAVLLLAVILPAAKFFSLSLITLRIAVKSSRAEPAVRSSPRMVAKPTPAGQNSPPAEKNQPVPLAAAGPAPAPPSLPHPVDWPAILGSMWAVGFVLAASRLLGLHLRLRLLVSEARLPGDSLQARADAVRRRLQIKRFVRLRISDTAASPFVCGLGHPVIVLPARLLREMADAELCALLSHEMAHVRSHDIPWCIAWRWLQAFFWFHPLVWKIPEAHLLACEQEADRLAATQWDDSRRYAQSLAQLVLQVSKLSPVETTLTLNANSQISRRLMYLTRVSAGPWKWFHSLGATALTGSLAVIAAGWSLVEVAAASKEPALPMPPPFFAKAAIFREAVLVVQDEAGLPISGAKLRANGFRVKGRLHGNAYFWHRPTLGQPPEATTDDQGRAHVTYPVDVIPEEKLELSDLTFSVSHPDFVPAQIDFAVDRGEAAPLTIVHGIRVELSGYFGADRQPTAEVVPRISPGAKAKGPETWESLPNGALVSRQIAPGSHLLQLMARLPSGRIVYSESVEVTTERGKAHHFDLELKPGGRIEGRLDNSVSRPVKNGRVILSVRPKQVTYRGGYSADGIKLVDKFGYLSFWTSYRPLSPEGTFVFESIPPGDVEIVAWGDGFVSKNGSESSDTQIGVPQLFSQTETLTKIEVATEPSAILIVTAKTAGGAPVVGATISTSPNMYQGFGTTLFAAAHVNSEEPFHSVEPLPFPVFSAVTGPSGVAQISNLPSRTYSFEVFHPDLELALEQSPPEARHQTRSRSKHRGGRDAAATRRSISRPGAGPLSKTSPRRSELPSNGTISSVSRCGSWLRGVSRRRAAC